MPERLHPISVPAPIFAQLVLLAGRRHEPFELTVLHVLEAGMAHVPPSLFEEGLAVPDPVRHHGRLTP